MAEQSNRKRCGAKTRSGGKCKRWAMPNGRCNLHGGKSTGPPKGSTNSLKHGIYSSALKDDEKAVWSRIDVDGIDDEIRVAKLQLKRALEEQRKADEHADDEKVGFELAELKDEKGVNATGSFAKKARVKKRPDYRAIIDRLFGRIAQLQQVKSQLPGGQGSPQDAARQIREALDAIEQSTAPDAPMDGA